MAFVVAEVLVERADRAREQAHGSVRVIAGAAAAHEACPAQDLLAFPGLGVAGRDPARAPAIAGSPLTHGPH